MLKNIVLAAALYLVHSLSLADGFKQASQLTRAEETYESLVSNPAAINSLIGQADANNPYANFYVGVAYATGRWVDKNVETALPFLVAASDKIPAAALNVGILYYVRGQVDSAMPYLVVAGGGEKLDGLPQAMVLIGRIYERGEGSVGRNYVAAWRWYEAAARRKDIEATGKLGELSLNGLGRSPDPKTGKIYLERAAGQWNASAQRQLYEMSAKGIGSGINRTEAAKWSFIQASQSTDRQKINTTFPEGLTDLERSTGKSMADLWIVAHPKYPTVNYLALVEKVAR